MTQPPPKNSAPVHPVNRGCAVESSPPTLTFHPSSIYNSHLHLPQVTPYPHLFLPLSLRCTPNTFAMLKSLVLLSVLGTFGHAFVQTSFRFTCQTS